MKPHFNLVDEPWIPCLLPDHRAIEFSLSEVLTQAYEVREIYHPSPLVVTALHRLLLAILHRNFGPETLADWQVLWGKGRWDEAALKDYFTRWHDHFYLFHPERPFYQVPRMADVREHPVHLLALEAAAGNNPTLFDHNSSARPTTFYTAQAARYVLARQGFSIGFGKSHPIYFQDSPLVRGYSVLIKGNNLWETLALNLIQYNRERPIPQSGLDLPAWEVESFPEPDPAGNRVQGYLAYLTWQSRRIHLIPEGEPPVVRYCQIQQNLKLPEPRPVDPFKSYRRDEKQGWLARGLMPERTIWRDSHTLFQVADQSIRRPEVFNWAARIEMLRRAGEVKAQKNYRLTVTGMATEAGKAANLLLWRQERLPLPLAYLDDINLLGQLKVGLALAEKANDTLSLGLGWVASLVLSPESGGAGSQAQQGEVGRLLKAGVPATSRTGYSREVKKKWDILLKAWAPGRLYWPRLEAPFRRLLVELPDDREDSDDGVIIYGNRKMPEWTRTVYQAASDTFEEVAAGLERSVRSLKAVARVEGFFRSWLHKELLKGGES